jgi:peptide/nickel transport system substrate-binding protein
MQANDVSPDSLRADHVEVEIVASDSSFLFIPICKSEPPFDDVRVRKALNLAIDRDALNQALLDGDGEPMWGLFTSGSVFFPSELEDIYAYDPDEAQRLLEEAGATDLEAGIVLTGQPLADRFGEAVAGQWSELGIDASTHTSTNIVEDFFVGVRYPMAAIPLARTGLDKVTRNFQAGSIGNVCDYQNDELDQLVEEIRALEADSEEAIDAWVRMQEILIDEEAGAVWGLFTPQINAFDSERVGGARFVPDVFGNLVLDVTSAYIRA